MFELVIEGDLASVPAPVPVTTATGGPAAGLSICACDALPFLISLALGLMVSVYVLLWVSLPLCELKLELLACSDTCMLPRIRSATSGDVSVR